MLLMFDAVAYFKFCHKGCELPSNKRTGLCLLLGHVVGQLVEALCYKLEGHGLIPDGVTGIFH